MKRCLRQVCLNAPPSLLSTRQCALNHVQRIPTIAIGGEKRRYYSENLHSDVSAHREIEPLFSLVRREATDKDGGKSAGDSRRKRAETKKEWGKGAIDKRQKRAETKRHEGKSASGGGRDRAGEKTSRRRRAATPSHLDPALAAERESKLKAREVALRIKAERRKAEEEERKMITKLDQSTLNAERMAKMDVYNYSARFGLIPTFAARKGRNARGVIFHEATIELKEHNILATAITRKSSTAEIAASIKFKELAEQYHIQNGGPSMVIKDATALNTANVKDFFTFYRNVRRNSRVEISSKETARGSVEAQVTLDGDPIGDPVSMLASKKAVEDLASLIAAITLTQSDPQMLVQFQERMAEGMGNILPPARTLPMELSTDTIRKLQSVMWHVEREGLPQVQEDHPMEREDGSPTLGYDVHRLTDEELVDKSAELKHRQQRYLSSSDPKIVQKRTLRESLPMDQHRDNVLKHINENMYSVIIGATGSGKTTQVPQILLEDAIARDVGAICNVICTQPRRIAATSVARRVADERNERLRDSVGYHVRFDTKLPVPGGSITYCTTGILLQRLQRFPDQVLNTLSHIIIDEVHERDIIIDFLMVTLKKLLPERRAAGKPVPKVVLMSATIDSELFAKYFEETTPDGVVHRCPSLSIPGRTFPVKEKYFEDIVLELQQKAGTEVRRILRDDKDTQDYMQIESSFKSAAARSTSEDAEATIDWKRERTVSADGQLINEQDDSLVPISLVVATVAHIAKTTTDGAILIFLPGYEEIKKVKTALTTTTPLGINFNEHEGYRLSTLHSSVPATEQAAVFEPVPPGCRKVILSTNIAETSVTIPDIQHVVDTGKLREKRYDQVRGITKLQCTWISKSNAKQRAGRAGRVQNGNYYALYTRARYDSLRAIGLPEMLRSDLQEVCLDIKAQSFKSPIREFLAASIEPPSPVAVESAVLGLQTMQALTEDERITALGRLLASLPIHPSLGKMIVLGVIFRCLDPMVILGAALNERSMFASPPDRKKEAREAQRHFFDEETPSDHLALISAFKQMRNLLLNKGEWEMVNFGMQNFVHVGAFKTINQTTKQIEEVLIEAGLIPDPSSHQSHAERAQKGQIGVKELNRNSQNLNLVRALVLAGLHPNLAIPNGRVYRTKAERAALIHPSSINFAGYSSRDKPSEKSAEALLSFSTLMKSNDGKSTFMRDTTPVSPLQAVLFGGKLTNSGKLLTVDKWLPFLVEGPWGSADKIIKFRGTLDLLLGNAFKDLARLKGKKVGRGALGRRVVEGENDGERGTYLADDRVRELFATGLVEVLDLDQKTALDRMAKRASIGNWIGNGRESLTGQSDHGRWGDHERKGYEVKRAERRNRRGSMRERIP